MVWFIVSGVIASMLMLVFAVCIILSLNSTYKGLVVVDQEVGKNKAELEDSPKDPSRRKLLKVIGGSAGAVAVGGGIFLLGRDSANQTELPPGTTLTPERDVEATPQTTIEQNETESTVRQEGTSSSVPSAETINNIPLESLPVSIEEPSEWIEKIYGLLDTVFNEDKRDLLEYVYKGGRLGNAGQALAGTLNIVHSLRQAYPEVTYVFEASVNEENTSLTRNIISVDETRSFIDAAGQPVSTKRLVDFGILPEEVFIDRGEGSEMITLYLINRTTEVCVYDENGICR